MIFFLFGLLGAGKNFVGRVFADEFGFTFYDADKDLTTPMKEAIASHKEFTEQMRDEYFGIVIERMAELRQKHKKLVISQALFKNRHRGQILAHFPGIKFLWVQSDGQLIGKRLGIRKDHPAGRSYGELVNRLFEEPSIPHEVLVNNGRREEIVEQVANLLEKH